MIGIVRNSIVLDPLTRSLLTLCSAYDVRACSYMLNEMDTATGTVHAVFWAKGSFVDAEVNIPSFSDFRFVSRSLKGQPLMEQKWNYLRENTTVVDNTGVPKEYVPQIMMRHALSVYAIPTYRVQTLQQLRQLLSVIPNAIIKPSDGRKGIGVRRILRSGSDLIMEGRNSFQKIDESSWADYLQNLEGAGIGSPILQPRLDFSLDEQHAVDFRLLVARGGTGDWETVAIYPRIGAGTLVSNIAQGGYIGDCAEILSAIAGNQGKAAELMEELRYIAVSLPPLIQNYRTAPIAALGIDVGIDRESLRPFVLEANTKPSTKLHTWMFAEKKVQYYKYLLSNNV